MSLLSACGGGGGGDADVGEETGPRGPRGVAEPMVVLLRYGGVTGSSDRVSVDAVGVTTVVSDRSPSQSTRTLLSGDLAALRRALENSEIATLERNYLDPRAVDAYQYDVTYQGVTVTADEGVLPTSLRPVVDMLTKLLPT
ncbi:MAG TPA: hypothetical protein VGV86_04855 [Acidimicrobiales bacterium]|nr:hypothetical protein [Acidimicrobiales bacterium]